MEPTVRHFADDGRTPNHPRLPLVILHVDELPAMEDPAAWLERRFMANGWKNTWRWVVYPFHHYHTNAHEVLGVFAGSARLKLGGERGGEFDVRAGDVLVLPAGLGHMGLSHTPDFEVVGAYPGGKEPDLVRAGEMDTKEALRAIARVPLPDRDPISGEDGPLMEIWKE